MRNFLVIFGSILIILGIGSLVIGNDHLFGFNTAEKELRKGIFLLEQGSNKKTYEAIDVFSNITIQYVDTIYEKKALYFVAESYERLKKYRTALKKFRELLGKSPLPKNLEKRIQFKIAKIQVLRSYTKEGISILYSLLSNTLDPDLRSEIYLEIGKAYYFKQNYKEAKKYFKISLSEDSANTETILYLAKSLQYLGEYKLAYEMYHDYVRYIEPFEKQRKSIWANFKVFLYKQAVSLYKQKSYTEALSLFRFIHKNFPNTVLDEYALYYSGMTLMEVGKYTRAIRCFEFVLENHTENLDDITLLKLGQVFFLLKKYEKALQYLVKMQEVFPQSKYAKIAKTWEEEVYKILNEKNSLEREVLKEELELANELVYNDTHSNLILEEGENLGYVEDSQNFSSDNHEKNTQYYEKYNNQNNEVQSGGIGIQGVENLNQHYDVDKNYLEGASEYNQREVLSNKSKKSREYEYEVIEEERYGKNANKLSPENTRADSKKKIQEQNPSLSQEEGISTELLDKNVDDGGAGSYVTDRIQQNRNYQEINP